MLMSAVLAPELPVGRRILLPSEVPCLCTQWLILVTGYEQQADSGFRDLPNGHDRFPGGKTQEGNPAVS